MCKHVTCQQMGVAAGLLSLLGEEENKFNPTSSHSVWTLSSIY